MSETRIDLFNKEISAEFAKKDVAETLLKTTFKGLTAPVMKQAILEGMIRGFTFKDFLEKNVYAIPFSSGYSLITSVDYARKIGMRNGMCGQTSPVFEENGATIISCEVTIKRRIDSYIGEYTAKVYMSEYSTGRNLWTSKPRTMLSKVASMHAMRMAFPEDLSQIYVEEELEKTEVKSSEIAEQTVKQYDPTPAFEALNNAKNIEELKSIFIKLPAEAKTNEKVVGLKNELKVKLTTNDKLQSDTAKNERVG